MNEISRKKWLMFIMESIAFGIAWVLGIIFIYQIELWLAGLMVSLMFILPLILVNVRYKYESHCEVFNRLESELGKELKQRLSSSQKYRDIRYDMTGRF